MRIQGEKGLLVSIRNHSFPCASVPRNPATERTIFGRVVSHLCHDLGSCGRSRLGHASPSVISSRSVEPTSRTPAKSIVVARKDTGSSFRVHPSLLVSSISQIWPPSFNRPRKYRRPDFLLRPGCMLLIVIMLLSDAAALQARRSGLGFSQCERMKCNADRQSCFALLLKLDSRVARRFLLRMSATQESSQHVCADQTMCCDRCPQPSKADPEPA